MRSLKVLILEDHPFQLMALHQMLNANGVFDVLTAESVEGARQTLSRRGRVDIAICDLHMDGQDGLELIRHLADSGLAAALIILSSAERGVLDSVADLARQLGLRVLGSLQKPACSVSLHKLLRRYLDEPGDTPPAVAVPVHAELLALSADEVAQSKAQWVVHYQPKVGFDGTLAGVEALVRWQHPSLGLLGPGQFFPLVEGAGLLETLSWHVLDQALAFSVRFREHKGQPLPVAVNIAPQMLVRDDFAAQVIAALQRHDVPASALTLEVIETHGCQLDSTQLEGLLHLRILGCQLSIDDFGMGVSNLQRLLELPFSELKLPSEFVRGMADDGRKAAVVAGALIMARRMDLKVVVEGVETVDDLMAIKALGSPVMQGYFIARPMAGEDLCQWMLERESDESRQRRRA
ncbi:EAL domain-containing response regulator [Pseudomonas wadenswilerensis]|jgi:EAL domain-containing protein (putative c-di-GMP-specific phosphodiesterase class I)/ActR/RegA family two-component response regulator|uniref:EAL domain-containing response regulator n=1 Tax=Pseudomonas TaxID=286 RepID=UPI000F96ADBF|nr:MULTISPECIES: EAL domain-containing response regulator [unclassified Pseudomonas]MCE5980365.1 EAL domain-containing response regulator [Pseudomonas sp. LF19]SPO68350.1 Response regulator/EAL domain protein [Pseudomonas sp. JV241A]